MGEINLTTSKLIFYDFETIYNTTTYVNIPFIYFFYKKKSSRNFEENKITNLRNINKHK